MIKQDVMEAIKMKDPNDIGKMEYKFIIENKFYAESTYDMLVKVSRAITENLEKHKDNEIHPSRYIYFVKDSGGDLVHQMSKDEVEEFYDVYRQRFVEKLVECWKLDDWEGFSKYVNIYLSPFLQKEVHFYQITPKSERDKLEDSLKMEMEKLLRLTPQEDQVVVEELVGKRVYELLALYYMDFKTGDFPYFKNKTKRIKLK